MVVTTWILLDGSLAHLCGGAATWIPDTPTPPVGVIVVGWFNPFAPPPAVPVNLENVAQAVAAGAPTVTAGWCYRVANHRWTTALYPRHNPTQNRQIEPTRGH